MITEGEWCLQNCNFFWQLNSLWCFFLPRFEHVPRVTPNGDVLVKELNFEVSEWAEVTSKGREGLHRCGVCVCQWLLLFQCYVVQNFQVKSGIKVLVCDPKWMWKTLPVSHSGRGVYRNCSPSDDVLALCAPTDWQTDRQTDREAHMYVARCSQMYKSVYFCSVNKRTYVLVL